MRAAKLALTDPGWALRRAIRGPSATIEQPPRLRTASAPKDAVRISTFEPSVEEQGGAEAVAAGAFRLGESDVDAPAAFGPKVLNSVIRRVEPDLIHSMEFQHSSYLTLAAKERYGLDFPKWLASNWGSDIFYYRRFPEHESQIRRTLRAVDLYSCECERDWALGREYGFAGPRLPMLTNTGGFDLDQVAKLRSPMPPSKRKIIMIKGYDHFAGRAMTSLRVLERFAAELKGYEIVLYSVSAEPRRRAVELREQGLLNIRIIEWGPHEEILGNFGRARMYMGISISDAISTSVLESMAMGAFPIQTDTSCCNEWFTDGEGGFIVSPDNFEQICDRFHRALTDDALVDRAAAINYPVIKARLDVRSLKYREQVFYDEAFAHLGLPLSRRSA